MKTEEGIRFLKQEISLESTSSKKAYFYILQVLPEKHLTIISSYFSIISWMLNSFVENTIIPRDEDWSQ